MIRPLRHTSSFPFQKGFLAICVAALLVGPSTEVRAEPVRLLFRGNTRGVLDPLSGGVEAQAHHEIGHLRRLHPDLFLLSPGNVLGPSLTSQYDGGAEAVRGLDAAGYDAVAVGGHDLFQGLDNLLGRVAEARVPFLATNLRARPDLPEHVLQAWRQIKTSLRVTRGEKSVHLFGLVRKGLASDNPRWSSRLEVLDPEKAIRERRVEAAGADLVVVLATLPSVEAHRLLRRLPWVDLVITNTAAGDDLAMETSELRLRDGRMVVWTPRLGRALALVELSRAGAGLDAAVSQVPLHEGVPEDPDRADAVARVAAAAEQATGTFLTDLSEWEQRNYPAALLDALRVELGAEVAFLPRRSFTRQLGPERLTKAELRQTFPFPDRAAVLTLEGRKLAALFARKDSKGDDQRDLEIVGMQERQGKLLVNGRLLVKKRRYRVATSEYLALGGLELLPRQPGAVRRRSVLKVVAAGMSHPGDRRARVKAFERRPVRTVRTVLDIADAGLDFGGSASTYQFKESSTSYIGSDIPQLVGNEHTKTAARFELELVEDRPHRDLILRLNLGWSEFRTTKTNDIFTMDLRYEAKDPFHSGPRVFGALDFNSTFRTPNTPNRERPIFVKAVAGLFWNLSHKTKVLAGVGRLERVSQPGSPGHTGLNLGFEMERDLRRGIEFRTNLDTFASGDSAEVRTADWTYEFRFKLGNSFSTVWKGRHFFYKDATVSDRATRTERYLGLSWDRTIRGF